MDNREVNYSESRNYMGRSGKGLTIWPNKKQKASTAITNQDFRKFLKEI